MSQIPAIFDACIDGNVDLMSNLLKAIKVDARALRHNIEDRYLTELTKKFPIDETKEREYNTLLHAAVLSNKPKMIDYVINDLKFKTRSTKDRRNFNILIIGVMNGCYDVVKYLISQYEVNIWDTTEDGLTLLCYAVMYDKVTTDFIDHLIEKCEMDINNGGGACIQPILLAAKYTNVTILKHLIQKHKPECIDVPDLFDESLLHYALLNPKCTTEMIDFIIKDCGIDIHAVNGAGETPISIAASCGTLTMMNYLVDTYGAVIKDVADNNNATLLHAMGYNVNCTPEMIDFAINDCGCEVDARDTYDTSVLHSLSSKGKALDAFKHLVEKYNADVNIVDDRNSSPFASLLCGGFATIEFIKYICSKLNDEFEIEDSIGVDGETPIFIAAQKSNLDVIKYLIEEKKANPAGETPNYETIFKFLLSNPKCTVEMIQYMIKACGIDLTKIDTQYDNDDLKSPLICAIKYNHYEGVQYLLQNKANVNQLHRFKRTPLHIAAYMGTSPEIMNLLIDNGAKLDAEDQELNTPLFVAAFTRHRYQIVHLTKIYNDKKISVTHPDGLTIVTALSPESIKDDEDWYEDYADYERITGMEDFKIQGEVIEIVGELYEH